MQSNSITPAPKAQPVPVFLGFDSRNGKQFATFALGAANLDIPYSEARAYAVTNQALLVPAWLIAGGK